ncbi:MULTISPECIES: hypothetical protein [Actinomadura]|uniref:Uncharacterized protein n=2 Tax=Actinomadura yumaensis TaxID=111807 RepID=A0ABW2CJL9_9ACTN|nr:hypothetical protein [Actinomadura sp. J1-007]MWK38825.1 hypothetical protein [Actinomadura sp. J1-007]
MIIDFEREGRGNLLPNGEPVDLATADSGNLLYSLFPGRLILRSGSVDLSTAGSESGHLSLLNVVTYFPRAFSDAIAKGRGSVPFFDQDDVVKIIVTDVEVQVTRTYGDGVIHQQTRVLHRTVELPQHQPDPPH